MAATKFSTVRIPAAVRSQLFKIRDHLAGQLGSTVSMAQATVATIETTYRLFFDPDLAIVSRKDMAGLARRISDECNARNAVVVCGAVSHLTGAEAEIERSDDGRHYTITAGNFSAMLADSAFDLAGSIPAYPD